ncbi:allophanate hydrolase subunit 1 [Leifsonia sp. fls2-241-R2A-40a]|uniref:5-oxoprolinase subunit B family protein n=1 Tax=Leifsonia sp. fls2-241-R2A-40a TaxID=3040290 RepID=UPI00254A5AE8|nr:allophanate hydrolase subunit 1 [Leifsonia sp. fls2-241-R2A-40a]
MSRRVLPYGDRALLVELEGLDAVLALFRGLTSSRPAGVTDVVPAARTIAVMVEPRILPLSAARAWIERTDPLDPGAVDDRLVEVEVRYDGDDLADVAHLTGLTESDVVEFHTGSTWRVGFGGFAPGFAYLVREGASLDVPRRETPRTSVPPGSVGLAGTFSGVYPRSSPGGWQLIGRTDAVLWDEAADPPALLQPGTVVRFREVP